MSYKTLQAAMDRGEKVLAMMKSEGWKLNTHENMGWHWNLENGAIRLHESHFQGESRGFWTLMSREIGGSGGNPDWTAKDNKHYANPNDAVEAQVKLAREVLNTLIESVEHGESLLV